MLCFCLLPSIIESVCVLLLTADSTAAANTDAMDDDQKEQEYRNRMSFRNKKIKYNLLFVVRARLCATPARPSCCPPPLPHLRIGVR